jgi:hypothetical protein
MLSFKIVLAVKTKDPLDIVVADTVDKSMKLNEIKNSYTEM